MGNKHITPTQRLALNFINEFSEMQIIKYNNITIVKEKQAYYIIISTSHILNYKSNLCFSRTPIGYKFYVPTEYYYIFRCTELELTSVEEAFDYINMQIIPDISIHELLLSYIYEEVKTINSIKRLTTSLYNAGLT